MCHTDRLSHILIAFLMLNPPGVSGMNSSSCYRIILFTYCHIPSASISCRILRLHLNETGPSFFLLLRPWSVTLAACREREEDTQAGSLHSGLHDSGTRPWPSPGNCVRGAPPGGHRAQQPDELGWVRAARARQGEARWHQEVRRAAQLQRWVTRTDNDATRL